MSPFLNPTYIISVLIALSIHEWAHAMTADRLGDPTPAQNGRLTINPVAHLDLVGSILFLIVGFGWAKPVPVDSRYFRHPKRDLALVACAGPLSNFVLSIVAFILLAIATHGTFDPTDTLLSTSMGLSASAVLMQILQSSLYVNLALMAFNLFPLAPLDGSNILQAFIPLRYERRYEDLQRIGPTILIALIVLQNVLPVPILSGWVYGIMEGVLMAFVSIASLL